MEKRRLGNSDLLITPIGFGAWALGGSGWAFSWGPQDDRESIRTIHHALDLGINWIDTAAIYGLGHSEEVAAKVDRYGNYRSASFAEWHPDRLEMLIVTRFGDTSQVHRVTQPLGMREQLTFFDEPVLGVGDYLNVADPDVSFTITMDVGGDEFYQIYRFDTVNGVPANGGAIDGPGPAVAGGMLFVNSGYISLIGRPGNVLLAFGVD